MTRYLAARLAWLVAVMWGVATIAFILARAAPGDPAELFFERAHGRPPNDEEVAALRQQMGLTRPVLVQYVSFIRGLPRGDLGRSWATGDSVAAALGAGVPATAALAVSALTVAALIGGPLGIAAAYRPGAAADQISRALAVAGASVPGYVLGYLLMLVFSVRLGLLPVFGAGSPSHLILPAATLALATAATYARLVRASVLDTLGEEYVRAAQARGLSRRAVLARHALPNAILPLLTVVAISLGHLLGGAVIVEWVFAWPGLGRLAMEAIHARDYPLVQGVVLLGGAVFGIVSLVADMAYCWVDPRIRLVARSR